MAKSATRPAFRFPSVHVAEARLKELAARNVYPRLGCLGVLAIAGVPLLARVLAPIPTSVTLAAGIACLLVAMLLRRGANRALQERTAPAHDIAGQGCLIMVVATLGVSLTFTAVVGMTQAAGISWLGWTAVAVFAAVSLLIAMTISSRNVPGLLRAVSTARREGCHIAFFRPFRDSYSENARNLLIPILANYGHLYFVSDETFAKTTAEDLYFASDYRSVPGLIGGHTYAHEQWQQHVARTLDDIDVAVIDVSVLSPGVLWEVNQCYGRLPSHRILLVADANAFGDGPIEARVPAIHAHAVALVRALLDLNQDLPQEDPRRHVKPLLLAYLGTAEGRLWLAGAVHAAMLNIIAIEKTERPIITPQPGN